MCSKKELELLRRLARLVSTVPVIGKSDTCTREELHAFKLQVSSTHIVNITQFFRLREPSLRRVSG